VKKIENFFGNIYIITPPTKRQTKTDKMVLIVINGEDFEQCDDCGNVWDGNAQCNCWQWNWQLHYYDHNGDDDEAANDSGYEE